MKAIILAAGRGSRMKNLTEERPKCLVELHGKHLLEWQLSALREAGIEEIAIVTGYKRELLASRGLVEFYNSRWAETNMVASLSCAQVWLKTGPCIVSYSDIFYSEQAVRLLVDCPAPLAVTYDPNWLKLWTERFTDPLLDAETFRIKPDNTLAEIGNKPKSVEEVQGQYMGLLRFSPNSWETLAKLREQLPPHIRDKMHMTASLNLLIQEGVQIVGIPYYGVWGEIDTPSDLDVHTAK